MSWGYASQGLRAEGSAIAAGHLGMAPLAEMSTSYPELDTLATYSRLLKDEDGNLRISGAAPIGLNVDAPTFAPMLAFYDPVVTFSPQLWPVSPLGVPRISTEPLFGLASITTISTPQTQPLALVPAANFRRLVFNVQPTACASWDIRLQSFIGGNYVEFMRLTERDRDRVVLADGFTYNGAMRAQFVSIGGGSVTLILIGMN